MIFDTSSMMKLVFVGDIDHLYGSKTSPIAFYESSNVIWKKTNRTGEIGEEDAEKALELLEILESQMEVLNTPRKKVLETASREGISFYDSCFLTLAVENDERLVTEDSKLKRAAENHVESIGTDRLLE